MFTKRLAWLGACAAVVALSAVSVACSDDETTPTGGSSSGTSGAATTSGSSGDGTSGGTSGAATSGGTSGTPAATAMKYTGTFAGKGEGGSIEVSVTGGASTQTIRILALQPVTGKIHFSGGADVTVTGTYDAATGALTIEGGGYSFTGTLASGAIAGSYTGPKGAGSFSVVSGEGSTPYCGTFAGASQGVWNFVVGTNGTLAGSAVSASGTGDVLTGTVTNGAVSMTTSNKTTVSGTISGTSASGTWMNGSSTGTWTGAAGCQ